MSIVNVGRPPRLHAVPAPGRQREDGQGEEPDDGLAARTRLGVARMRVRLAQHITAEPALAPVVPLTAARSAQHRHVWQIAEIEYSDAGSVRRLACACGAIDFRSDG
jgi:hypothetical protein